MISRGDSIDLSVINPRREKSGVYKVILRNSQGQDERDINVNIMGQYTQRILTALGTNSAANITGGGGGRYGG